MTVWVPERVAVVVGVGEGVAVGMTVRVSVVVIVGVIEAEAVEDAAGCQRSCGLLPSFVGVWPNHAFVLGILYNNAEACGWKEFKPLRQASPHCVSKRIFVTIFLGRAPAVGWGSIGATSADLNTF